MKNIKIDDKIHKQMKIKSAELGIDISDIANQVLGAFLEGKIKFKLEYDLSAEKTK